MNSNLGNRSVSTHSGSRSAFTLIELLVVVSIIALLVSILLPALSKAREQAKAAMCKTYLRQVGIGVEMYQQENRWHLPPYTNYYVLGTGFESDGTSATINGVTYTQYRKHILPRVWEEPGVDTCEPRDGAGFLGPYLQTGDEGTNLILGCPSIPKSGPKTVELIWDSVVGEYLAYYYFSYGMNYEHATNDDTNSGGSRVYGPLSVSKIKDPSRLVFMCDSTGISPYVAAWSIGRLDEYNATAPGDRHNGRFNAVFVDGHVEDGTLDGLYVAEYFRR